MCRRSVTSRTPAYDDELTCLLQIFKIVLSKAFDLRCTIPEIEHVGEPLLLYQGSG